MKLWRDSSASGERIPVRRAAGRPDGAHGVAFSDNLNPHLAWGETPADPPRGDFFRWARVGLLGDDGPCPPFNDSLIDHCVFTRVAPLVARARVEATFTGAPVRLAVYPHALAEATHSGTCALNRRLMSAHG